MTAIAKHETNGQPMSRDIEQALICGDLSKLSPDQRLSYYRQTCDSLGLNYLTRPFDYITLNGKLTLYARKDAADQLRKIHHVSIDKPDVQFQDDWIIVTVSGRDASGRSDSEVGVVSKKDMRGDFGNAVMKAVTKAKRRLTLSICGLGMLDETEVESIPNAYRDPEMSVEANSLSGPEQLAARNANPKPVRKEYCSQAQYDALRDLGDELDLSPEERAEVLKPFGVTRGRSLSPQQADEAVLALKRRRVQQILNYFGGATLDDVRNEAPSVTADLSADLDHEQADAALAVLRKCRENEQFPGRPA